MADGPSVQVNIWQYYQTTQPGKVQVLGVDLYNGTVPQLDQFRATTAATYPLLQDGAEGAVDSTNLFLPYGQFDNYVVINKQGVIRYHAFDRWPHGNRYHLNEIRATIDSLVNTVASVVPDPVHSAQGIALRASPNPSQGATTLELNNSRGIALEARMAVFDLTGREVAMLWDRPLPAGTTRVDWDGRAADGSPLPAGIYVVLANVEGARLAQRVVRIR